MADTGSFTFLVSSLLVRIGAAWCQLALSCKDRPAKVARERWTKLRDGLRCSAGVVLRQRRDAIGNVVMVGAVELVSRLGSGMVAPQ
jgi:hypothetical protein